MASISNQAHVSFSYEGSDITRTNNSNVVNSTMLDEYSLEVEKTTSTDVFRPGDTLTYFVQVNNIGCGCVKDFHITDNLGGEENYLTYVEGSARYIANGSLNPIEPTSISPLEFDVNERLERDESFVLLYNVIVNPELSAEVTEITNTVDVTGHPCGCNCNNNNCVTATDTATITLSEFAEVLITKEASSDTYCCDDEIDYFITLTNIGNIDATNVVVTDSLPETFTTTEIHMENNGNHYQFDASEYTIDGANFLTLPNETGTAILVPAIAPGVDNTTRIRIHGHM